MTIRSLNDPNAPRILMRTALFVACGFLTSSTHTATLTVSSTAETADAAPGNGAWPDSAPEFSGNVAVISAQTLQLNGTSPAKLADLRPADRTPVPRARAAT